MNCLQWFLSFSAKSSSKHPVGFLTVGNKTAPFLTQKGGEFFFSTPGPSLMINSSNRVELQWSHRPQTLNIFRPASTQPAPGTEGGAGPLERTSAERAEVRGLIPQLCAVPSTFN